MMTQTLMIGTIVIEAISSFDWINEYPERGSNHQSSINIDIRECDDNGDGPIYLKWIHHAQHYAVRNNGHHYKQYRFKQYMNQAMKYHLFKMYYIIQMKQKSNY